MKGEQLRVELLKREGEHKNGGYELAVPVSVTAKHKIHKEIVTKHFTVVRVWPRAYDATNGDTRAFWPLFDCAIES